jgi:hypothetical protein
MRRCIFRDDTYQKNSPLHLALKSANTEKICTESASLKSAISEKEVAISELRKVSHVRQELLLNDAPPSQFSQPQDLQKDVPVGYSISRAHR